jgi:predicted transcriptional regulator
VRRLGELEAAIMDRLWARDAPTTVREIVQDLREQRQIAYTTVQTVTDILYRKGWLHRQRDGRAHRYRPLATREQYSAALMSDALAESRDRTAALAAFMAAMSAQDAAALRRALAQLEAGRPAGVEQAG